MSIKVLTKINELDSLRSHESVFMGSYMRHLQRPAKP